MKMVAQVVFRGFKHPASWKFELKYLMGWTQYTNVSEKVVLL